MSAGAGCAWTAASSDPWITVTSGVAGNGNGSVAFTVASNPFNVRTGTLLIAGQTLTVQQATSCTFQLDRTTVSFPTIPGTGVTRPVYVTASGSLCNWTATTSDSWITIVSGGTYVDSATVRLSATANTTGAPRTGSVLIAGQTVTVTQ